MTKRHPRASERRATAETGLGNLKDPPLFLTPQMVRGVLGIGHPKRVTLVPVEKTRLADGPKKKTPQPFDPAEAPASIRPDCGGEITRAVRYGSQGPRRDVIGHRHAADAPPASEGEPEKKPAPRLAEPKTAKSVRASSDWIARRQLRLAAATAYLKRRCILVDPVDRHAAIKRYRVSGKRDSMLADEVIRHAVALGMEMPD